MTTNHQSLATSVACYVLGTGTNVGKTLFSAALLSHALQREWRVRYLKPVQTGWPKDDDARTVADALALVANDSGASRPDVGCLFHYEPAVSPHRARGLSENAVSDEDILNGSIAWLHKGLTPSDQQLASDTRPTLHVIEGAGGALSPMPSGKLTADVLRPLRLPIILVGEWRLGGISQTLSTLDALNLRGFDVPLIVLFDGEHENGHFVSQHLSQRPGLGAHVASPLLRTQVVTLTIRLDDPEKSAAPVRELLCAPQVKALDQCLEVLTTTTKDRHQDWEHLRGVANNNLWWPFTQHRLSQEPAVIDDAFGSNLGVAPTDPKAPEARLGIPRQDFDGSASWWTLGLGHGHPDLARAVAYGAGRYGHVLFPGQVHAPAAHLATRLVHGIGQGWAQRVFFSDNGSTSVEVALKMAFRLAEARGVLPSGSVSGSKVRPLVLGLSDSYHGDTLGACNATSPNLFKAKDLWYQPMGIWIKPPLLALVEGLWRCVDQGPSPLGRDVGSFSCIKAIFDFDHRIRSAPSVRQTYLKVISEHFDAAHGRIGAVLIEPIIHGAAGMLFVDPLFQRTLIDEAKRRRLPVIYDEVFSGFWRFGAETAISFLAVPPDIACYSKTLTGGVLPLAVTVTSEETYENFLGESKDQALLHGHSYTAHPVGCAAALAALTHYESLKSRTDLVHGYWNEELLVGFSYHHSVTGVVSLGTIVAISLASETSGYGSHTGDALIRSLREDGILARSLGSVVYLIAHPMATASECATQLRKFEKHLNAWNVRE